MTLVIHLNGWPGTGKRTVGALLAARLGARLLDNHALLNPAESLFERNDPRHGALRQAVRALVLDHAAAVDPGTALVLTDALAANDPHDAALFEDVRRLAIRRGARLVPVVLDIAEQENLHRLQAPGRAEQRKLTQTGVLRTLRRRYALLRPDGYDSFALDVTTLGAEEAADILLHRIEPQARNPAAPRLMVP